MSGRWCRSGTSGWFPPQDDHRTAAGLLGVLRELASDPMACSAGTPVISSCQAGCRAPGRRSRSAIARAGRRGPPVLGEHQVETPWSPTAHRRSSGHDRDAAGDGRRRRGVLLPDVEARQQNLDVVRPLRCAVRGRVDAFEIQVPLTPYRDSEYRKPSDPLGTTGRPLAESTSTVLNAEPSLSSPRSAEVRDLPGTYAPSFS